MEIAWNPIARLRKSLIFAANPGVPSNLPDQIGRAARLRSLGMEAASEKWAIRKREKASALHLNYIFIFLLLFVACLITHMSLIRECTICFVSFTRENLWFVCCIFDHLWFSRSGPHLFSWCLLRSSQEWSERLVDCMSSYGRATRCASDFSLD